ncbi:hypothetical protein [Allorhodopirellula solitaria]|uniref:Uncharacterized protein n=1 Tax=Allorhodopirellula solitaria TaxID=2527987 RepID=A0A5C5X1F3_9BACT|nr:hypothetical protein [Allorhodopirellula solitaria]TWT56121.1 hypothetical protein CA85_44630 [Allorhodopirellula solitaria]
MPPLRKTHTGTFVSPSAHMLPSLKMSLSLRVLLVGASFAASFLLVDTASAQITVARSMAGSESPVATLEEQLINRLHATTTVQADYLRHVAKLVDQKKLEARLVIAIEKYALHRNPRYAFPYFERALRYEAAKRGVALPSMRHYQSTSDPRG